MKLQTRTHPLSGKLKHLTLALTAGAALLAGSASADTTVSGSQTVGGDPLVNFWNTAGIVTFDPAANFFQSSAQSAPPVGYVIPNSVIFSGDVTLRFNGNDTKWNFAGPVSATGGPQTITIRNGDSGNGDREDVLFSTPVPDGSGGALGFNVNYTTQTDSLSYVNLSAVNTFTGDITLNTPNNNSVGYLVVGGERYSKAFDPTFYTVPGSGSLGPAGVYPGNVTLPTRTILDFNTSANQTMSGVISGVGKVVKEIAGSTLTLSGLNTYTGNTEVTGGSLVLANGGGLSFVVTDATSNKVTGAGSATLNGQFTIDTSAVTLAFGSWPLVDTTTKSFGGTFSVAGYTQNGPIWTYVNGAQIFQFNTGDGKLYLSGLATINSFGIPGSAGVIDDGASTIALTVPYNPWGIIGLSTLAPDFAVSSGTVTANGNAVTSGSAPTPSFAVNNPTTYTVTDGMTVRNYTVTVTVTAASTGKAISNLYFPGYGYAWAADNTGVDPFSLLMVVPAAANVTALAPTFSISPFATVDVASGTPRDFTAPKTYTVTAEDGSSQLYTVTVQKITGVGVGTYQQNVLASGPVSYWPLNETSGTTATDLARGINPIAYGGTYTQNQTGLRPDGNPSVLFNGGGTTGTPGNPTPTSLKPKTFTVEAWVRPNNTAVQYLVSDQDRTTPNRLGYALWKNNGSAGFGIMAGNGSAFGVAVNGATVAEAGKNYHVVGTYDGTDLKLYVNGNLEGSVPLPNLVVAATAHPGFTIGTRNGATGAPSNIQDVAVYTRALSQAEIQAHTGFIVTYNGNGNDGGTAPGYSIGYNSGDSVTVSGNTGGLTKTGTTFLGWNTQANGLGTTYNPASVFSITGNITLYAKWGSPYESWAFGYGLTGGDAAADFDFDKDGLANGIEFVTNSSPTSGTNPSPLRCEVSGSDVLFIFERAVASKLPNVTAAIEVSLDMTADSWGIYTVPDTTSGQFSVLPNGATETIILTVPKGVEPRMYGRLKVQITP